MKCSMTKLGSVSHVNGFEILRFNLKEKGEIGNERKRLLVKP